VRGYTNGVQHIIQNQTTTIPKISPIGLLVVANALLGWKRKMHETETSYTPYLKLTLPSKSH